jgi:hypothetical protein
MMIWKNPPSTTPLHIYSHMYMSHMLLVVSPHTSIPYIYTYIYRHRKWHCHDKKQHSLAVAVHAQRGGQGRRRTTHTHTRTRGSKDQGGGIVGRHEYL